MNITHKTLFVFEVRTATLEDIDGILKLDNEVWTDFPADRDMIESRILVFQEGNFVAVYRGEIIGYLSLQFIGYDLESHPTFSWDEITDNGTLRKSHNPAGQYMYGVGMTVSPHFQNFGIATRLIFAGWSLIVRHNKKGCLLGSRMPGYSEAGDRYSPEEYLSLKRIDGRFHDPELRLYQGDGFSIIGLLPEYENDPPSRNYGVLIYQANPFYNKGIPILYRLTAYILARWGHKVIGV